MPEAARGTPFGLWLHAVATYLKTFQALSYERLLAALSDLLGLTLSQGGLINLLQRAQSRCRPGHEAAVSALRLGGRLGRDRRADRGLERLSLGVPRGRRRGAHGLADAGRHRGAGDDGRAPARGVDLEPLHGPAGSCSRTPDLPLAHLACDVAYVVEASDDPVHWRLQFWLASVFAQAEPSPSWPPLPWQPSAEASTDNSGPSSPRRAAAT